MPETSQDPIMACMTLTFIGPKVLKWPLVAVWANDGDAVFIREYTLIRRDHLPEEPLHDVSQRPEDPGEQLSRRFRVSGVRSNWGWASGAKGQSGRQSGAALGDWGSSGSQTGKPIAQLHADLAAVFCMSRQGELEYGGGASLLSSVSRWDAVDDGVMGGEGEESQGSSSLSGRSLSGKCGRKDGHF
ncbi:unnamed protein product [Pleuronectes platessa]|uniref:Uncharacterized protein n=1 Tax=Pleuronectes platessa TaxID=8262 RepID=A0A9N7VLC6_PLEPL|nr:unnamed protein product [Pleuronectes platessa]